MSPLNMSSYGVPASSDSTVLKTSVDGDSGYAPASRIEARGCTKAVAEAWPSLSMTIKNEIDAIVRTNSD